MYLVRIVVGDREMMGGAVGLGVATADDGLLIISSPSSENLKTSTF